MKTMPYMKETKAVMFERISNITVDISIILSEN